MGEEWGKEDDLETIMEDDWSQEEGVPRDDKDDRTLQEDPVKDDRDRVLQNHHLETQEDRTEWRLEKVPDQEHSLSNERGPGEIRFAPWSTQSWHELGETNGREGRMTIVDAA